ncbi:MAG: CARDB domain-containing protein, partial [Archaeoglobaceae archaeon]
MKRYGLMGIVLLALLAMAATPAMAQEQPEQQLDLNVTEIKVLVDNNVVNQIVLGQTANIVATIKNEGDATAQNFGVRFLVLKDATEVLNETVAVQELEAGVSTELSVSWRPTAVGSYTIRVIADPEGVIEESNENNNERSRDVEVLAAPIPTVNVTLNASGLYLLDFKVEPVPPAVALKELNVNITKVKLNNTNLTATLSGTVYLYINGIKEEDKYCNVELRNNTSDWVDCRILYTLTPQAPNSTAYNVSVGNSSHYLNPVTTYYVYATKDSYSFYELAIDMLKVS